MRSLIGGCLRLDPTQRLTLDDIKTQSRVTITKDDSRTVTDDESNYDLIPWDFNSSIRIPKDDPRTGRRVMIGE